MTNTDQWVVHPNRSDLGADEPGCNGHFRPVSRPQRAAAAAGKCVARVMLPHNLSELADADGAVQFGGHGWGFVVGAAHCFAGEHNTSAELPPPFGYTRGGRWWWWDGTSSEDSRLDGPDVATHVGAFLGRLFPGAAITLTDGR